MSATLGTKIMVSNGTPCFSFVSDVAIWKVEEYWDGGNGESGIVAV